MAGAVELEIPRVELIESCRRLVREFEEAGEELHPFPLSFPNEDGLALVERLAREARGEGLPEGFVAHSAYWLVLEGTSVVGVSNLRHELTPFLRHEGGHIGYGVRPSARGKGFATEMLRQTLARAAELRLERVLIACDADNEPSVKTIVRNGGVLEADNVRAHDGRARRVSAQSHGRSTRGMIAERRTGARVQTLAADDRRARVLAPPRHPDHMPCTLTRMCPHGNLLDHEAHRTKPSRERPVRPRGPNR